MKRILDWLRNLMTVMWGEAGAFVEPVPESKMLGIVRELIKMRIAAYDKMVDDYQDFPVDREAYNLAAHSLRSVLWALDEAVKNGA